VVLKRRGSGEEVEFASPQSGGEAASDGHVAPTHLERTYNRSHNIENSGSIIALKQVLQGREVHTRLRTRGLSQGMGEANPHFWEYQNSSSRADDKQTPSSFKQQYKIQNFPSSHLEKRGASFQLLFFKYCP
jgi:hypothetical protein